MGGRRTCEKRTHRLQFNLTLKEYDRLVQLADREGMTLSAFIRAQVVHQELPNRVTPVARKTYTALGQLHSTLASLGRLLDQVQQRMGQISPEQLTTIAQLSSKLALVEGQARVQQSEIMDLPFERVSNEQ
ncbi:MAG: hypothetical protein AAFW75_29985 [Cyanobacteria bacterium J06636_16]